MASTFKDVISNLLSSLPNEVTLRLGCEVTKIANRTRGDVDIVEIEAADGFKGAFDDVVITAPLGWLKRSQPVFSPPLAPKITAAIHSLGYGNLDKVFLKFPKAFWNDATTMSYQGDQDLSTNSQKPAFPVQSLFLSPEYAHITNPAQ